MYLGDLFMNKQTADILKLLKNSSERNQRKLADASGYSLGAVNKAVKDLMEAGYIDSKFRLSSKAEELFEKNSPRNAIILAAGFGMRMVPINQSTPKPFLEVRGERLIERLIRQLHEESSLTILSITHDIDEVASSDHVIAMNNGTIALSGTPHEVFRDERKLKELQLDVPFALKFKNALKRKGIETGEHITMEGLVKDLCRSDSNM